MAFAVALLVAVALAIPAVRHLRETPPLETRSEIVTPATDQPGSFVCALARRLCKGGWGQVA
jgi:hypothetical protein